MTTYKVIKPYVSYSCIPPLVLPVGTKISWWAERGFCLSEAVNGWCVKLGKWTVEAWHDYFEKVEAE